jgi:radical SAM superfamily enzyme YgiQ (UPF0313 family)
MNILVINPPNIPFSEQKLLIEPIDVITLATYLQELNHNVKFLDMDCRKFNCDDLTRYIENEFMPDVVVVSYDYHIPLHTQKALENISKICKKLKEYNIKTIMIGKTVTYNPKIIDNIGFDIGIIGETENTIQNILNKGISNNTELSKINGIVFKENDEIIITSPNKEKYDLDKLPIPNRNIANLKDYIDIRSILTSRGCINQCDFCPTYNYWGSWRGKNAENVVKEIEYLIQQYDTKKIIFLDDNATANRKRMQEISKIIINKKINIKLGCLASINTYDKEPFELMYKAGFRWLHFGIESGSQKVLENNNKNFNIDYAKKVIKEVKQMGYRVRTSFIFDLPTTTKEDMEKTIEFIVETQPDEIRGHFLTLRLGTTIYNKLSKEREIPTQYIHSDKPLLENEQYSNNEMLKDIDNLVNILKQKDYKIVRDTVEWEDLEKLRNKDGKIKFLSFCPSRYGIDWEK